MEETTLFAIGFLVTSIRGVRLLDTAQTIYLIVVWVVLSMTCLILLNRVWPSSRRKAHNDVTGWQISILGTIYAVMIGFMLFAVWSNFQTAETNTDNEANALMNLYRIADGLPAAQRDAIHISASNYANAVINQEWPTMNRDERPEAGKPYVMKLWEVVTHTPTENNTQLSNLQQEMDELSDLSRQRRIRILESETKMPNILWAVLVLGGIITIASSCLIGSENVALHCALIFAISLLISMDRPFQGYVHVTPKAFIGARENMLNPGAGSQ
jgi:hypothetical protein